MQKVIFNSAISVSILVCTHPQGNISDDNDQLACERFSGSGGIQTHGLRVTSLLVYQLKFEFDILYSFD